MAKIDVVAENIAELLTNTVDMTSVFYDIFLNPTPMMVKLKAFDENNKLIDVEIPNRAMDRVIPYVGEGTPEGVIEAPIGSTYVDTLTSTVYYKVSGEATDPFGWNAVPSQNSMEIFISTYLEARGYVTTSSLNTYLNTHEYVKKSDVASDSDFGVVKVDNRTIELNSDEQISVTGITDANVNQGDRIIRHLWVGTEEEYATLFEADHIDQNTIYIMKDTGQILIGKTEVACNAFPSNASETLADPRSEDSFTAPANGWFILQKFAGIDGAKLILWNNSSGFTSEILIPDAAEYGVVSCPALKGESVTVGYNATGQTVSFKFIKAASNVVSYTQP